MDTAPIGLVGDAQHVPLGNETIRKPYSAVRPDLQALRQLTDKHPISTGKPFNGEQSLVLLRCEPICPGGVFAENQELPKGPPEIRKQFIFGLGEPGRFRAHEVRAG